MKKITNDNTTTGRIQVVIRSTHGPNWDRMLVSLGYRLPEHSAFRLIKNKTNEEKMY